MNSRSGGLAVGALFAVYAPLYGHYVTGMELPAIERFSCFAGSFSVICMAAGMLLSARPRSLDSPFGGLDRMYRLHRHLGVVALLLFLAHFATVAGDPEAEGAAAGAVLRESLDGRLVAGLVRVA